jgi:integrase/recombinase XerC
MNDAQLIDRYLDHVRVEKRLAARTVSLYTEDLKKLTAYAAQAKVALTQVHNAHIRRWVAQMHAGGRTGRGIALILSGWRGFYAWLGREGLVSSNPVQDVRAPKSPKPLPKALSVDDAVQLASFKRDMASELSAAGPPQGAKAPSGGSALRAARERGGHIIEARDAAIVELLYGSGLRVGELVSLDVRASVDAKSWLDLSAGDAHVIGKGSKRRSVPLGAKSIEAIRAWLALREEWLKPSSPEPQALFLSVRGLRMSAGAVWKAVKQRSQLAGLATPVHPHMLRHSFASHVLQSSQDLRAVQELLGHANISTTQVYTRLDFQHLAKAYDAAHPRAKRVDS